MTGHPRRLGAASNTGGGLLIHFADYYSAVTIRHMIPRDDVYLFDALTGADTPPCFAYSSSGC